MIRIGIVGAENSHSLAIAKLINVEKQFPDFSVDYIWGETPEFAAATSRDGNIPTIVQDPQEMIPHIDAVVIDHRHPMHHAKAAVPFIKAKKAVFVDKPFCYRVDEAKELLALAKTHNVPITSFSVVPVQNSFLSFCDEMKEIGPVKATGVYGPCDIESPYGSVFFYGIHHLEMAMNAFGDEISGVTVSRNGANAVANLLYDDGKIVQLNFVKEGVPNFSISAAGTNTVHREIQFDKAFYLNGIRKFTTMFKTGQMPESEYSLIKRVAVMQAIESALLSGQTSRIDIE